MLCSDFNLRVLPVSDCAAGSGQQAGEANQRRREVFPLRVRGLWEALHHRPPPQGERRHFQSLRKTKCLRLQHVALDPPPDPTVLPCRYTSARTPETSRTSAIFRAAGRSLRQVPVDVHPMLSAMKSCLHLFTVKMGSEIKFISQTSLFPV